MTNKQKLVVANELIGFQDGKLFDAITPIVEEASRLQKTEGFDTKAIYKNFSEQIRTVVFNIVGIDISFEVYESEEINAACYLVGLTPANVHASMDGKFKDMAMRMDMYTERLAKTGSLNVESFVDIENSKVYGEFSKIKFRGTISSGVLKSTALTERAKAFVIIHEVGHAFNMLAFIAQTCVMAYQTGDAFARLMSANPKEYKVILDDTSKKAGYSNPAVVREASSQTDPQSAFRIYTSLMFRDKFACSYDPSGKFNSPSIESSADSFAIRHGGYKEFLQLRSTLAASMYPANYSLQVVGRFIAAQLVKHVVSSVVKKSLVSAALSAAAIAGTMTAVGHLMGIITGAIFGTVFINMVRNRTMKVTNTADHAALLKRELVERAKANGLTKEELSFSIDLLKEADDIIKATNKQEPAVIRVLDRLIRAEGDRAIKDYADAQADLISNELFIKAKELTES